MITYVQSDLFTSPARVLVNTVNTVGVMGKGIAKEFKRIYPEMFAAYQTACEAGELTVGKLQLYRTPHKSVLNFPTKRHWRQPSRLADIEAGLKTFAAGYEGLDSPSVAFPQLGCGNGGLDWEGQVRPLMERYLDSLPIDVFIHIPDDAAAGPAEDPETLKTRLRSEPRDVPFAEFEAGIVAALSEEGVTVARGAGRVCGDELRDLWRRLSGFGLLSESDARATLGIGASPVVAALGQFPYLRPTRFVELSLVRGDWGTTAELLAAPQASGLMLVAPAREAGRSEVERPRQAQLMCVA